MAQKFTKVDVGADIELFYTGYVSYDDVMDSDDFIEALATCPFDETVKVVIYHCQYLDFPDKVEDISEKDLNILIDIYDDLVEDNHILFDEYIETDIESLEEDIPLKIVEEY